MTKAVSSKMPQDLIDRIEEAREEGETKSAAVRRLVRAGLRNTQEPQDGSRFTSLDVLTLIAGVFVVGAFVDAPDTIGYIALAVGVFANLYRFVTDKYSLSPARFLPQ